MRGVEVLKKNTLPSTEYTIGGVCILILDADEEHLL